MEPDLTGVETLTFDCYGTLIDWEGGISGAFRRAAERDGVRLEPGAVVAAYAEFEPQVEGERYRSYREVLRETACRVAARLGWSIDPARARFLEESLPGWMPFPDANAALERLAAKFRLAILSNVDDDLIARTAEHLRAPFAWMVTAQQVRSYKPAPAHFEAAIERAGGRGKLFHVGGSHFHDAAPARRLGLRVAWVNRGNEPVPPGGPRPDLVVPDLGRLADALGA